MQRTTIALIALFLVGCTTTSGRTESDAIADFISVSELEEREAIRTLNDFEYEFLTERYFIVKTRSDQYLAQFRRPCREFNQSNNVPMDIRYERNTLRSRFDTIRGCRIDKMFALDKTQAEELRTIGKAPGEET
jgi:hypothetical protein